MSSARRRAVVATAVAAALAAVLTTTVASRAGRAPSPLDERLGARLAAAGFTGRAASTLEARLGRRVDPRLAGPVAPVEPALARLDPLLAAPRRVSDRQVADLVAFVSYGLPDPRARPERLRRLVPARLPSGRPPLVFAFPG